jgi:hypothetical protein
MNWIARRAHEIVKLERASTAEGTSRVSRTLDWSDEVQADFRVALLELT